MSSTAKSYDVAIVGAGIAGCTAARLYAQQGLSVALIDRRSHIDDYKRMCTHFIQPSGTPVIQRLGLAPLIERAGGIRNHLDTWTRWGWIRVPEPKDGGEPPYGYSIRRETLDPLLRGLAAETPGVELMMATQVRQLTGSQKRVTGVLVRSRNGEERELAARLVVGADGRDSGVGAMAGVRAHVMPNNRFTYFAYYRNLELVSGQTGQAWVLEPDFVIAYPNDDGVSLVGCFIEHSKLPEFKRDLEGSFTRMVDSLPLAPKIHEAERVSPLLGKLSMPNTTRRLAVPGLAFIGDAAMSNDPLWAKGCGWAFQSAEWLADCTAPALMNGDSERDLNRALSRYRRVHRKQLLAFYLQTSDYSSARKLLPHEKLLLSSAAKDPAMAHRFTAFGEGLMGIHELLSPWSVGRALRVVLTDRFQGRAAQPKARQAV